MTIALNIVISIITADQIFCLIFLEKQLKNNIVSNNISMFVL